MKTGLKVIATFRNTTRTVIGQVAKYQACETLENNGVVWVTDDNGDTHKLFEGWDVIEAASLQEHNVARIVAHVERERRASAWGEYTFEDVQVYDDGIVYITTPSYTIAVEALENGKFLADTINRNRQRSSLDRHADFTANERMIAKFGTLKRYIERYAEQ